MSENRILNSFLQKRNRGIGDEDPFIIGDGEDNRPSYVQNFKPIKGKSRTTIVQEGIEQFGEAVVDDPVGVGKAIATGIYEGGVDFLKAPIKTTYDAGANVVQSIKNVGTKSLSDYLPEGITEKRATAEQMTAARQAQLNDYLNASAIIPAASVVKQSSKIIRKALPETGLLNEPTFVNTTANLKSLVQGDREFLIESKNPNLQGVGADVVKTAAIGDNQGPELDPTIDSDDPGINPTKPKSEVAPLVRPLDADVDNVSSSGDFYSPILANLDNLPIGKDGMLGSNIIKFLTKKASNINKTELNWSQLLFSGRRITDSENPTQLMEGEIPTLGIDPNRKYTKSEIKFLAKQNLPQITIQKLNPRGPNEGAPYQNVQRIPIIITKETKNNSSSLPNVLEGDPTNRNLPMEQRRNIALSRVAAREEQDNDPEYLASLGLNEDMIEAGIQDLSAEIPRATRRQLVILRFAGDKGNRETKQTATDYNYEETILRNNNTMGNTYRKSRAHYPKIEGSENIIAHSRGGYYLLDGDVPDEGGSFPAKSIFVLEELQTDAVQSSRDSPSTVASEATTRQTKDFLKEKELFDSTEGPGLGSVENENILARKLSALIQKNFDEGEEYLSTSDRFNRFANIESEADPFALAKQEEALDKISFDVNESKRILDQHYNETGRLVDARNKVVQYLSNKYERYGITINSLERGTDTFRVDSDGDVYINKVLSNFVGDLVYTKTVAKRKNLSGGISATISNKGPEAPKLNLSPVKLSETVRLSILATIKNSLSEGTTTIVIPPLKDIMKAHSLRQKPAEATYVGAVTKVLKDLQSETKGKINFKIGKIDRLEFESKNNYTIIDFEDFKIEEGTQLRLAEGGVVQPMEQQMQNILQEGGITDDGMNRDPVSGNEIPSGSLASEVRDDIPAQLSGGEYVVPADVVRFFGVKLFEDLRLEAKKGLQTMEENGRIGGEKIPNPSSNEITDADVDQIEQMLSEEGVEAGGLNQGGLLEKLVKTAQSNSMVNERMRAAGIPMQMNAGGAVGQQIPSNSQYNDPKKIDAVISKIASAAQQNPKLLRMLTERGINIPTNLASQNSEQLRNSNLPSQTTEPITNAASGGFIPTENYTEVQDMIANKAKKSSNVDNQMTQNFYHGGSVHDSYSVADVLAAPSLPNSYLTPGAGTIGSSGSNYQSAPIGPQEPEGGCAEGFMWNGIACVPIPVTVQSNNNDDGQNKDREPEPPKPWYEEEAIGDLTDDTWIENKLNPEEQPQGFVAGILNNMPIAKFGRHINKYTNIAEIRAASRLALAAGKIDDKRLAEIEANLQGYIKSEKLNDTWAGLSQGNFQEKSVMRSFDLDGDPSNLTEAEYNAYIVASGGTVEADKPAEPVVQKPVDMTGAVTYDAPTVSQMKVTQKEDKSSEREAARDRANKITKEKNAMGSNATVQDVVKARAKTDEGKAAAAKKKADDDAASKAGVTGGSSGGMNKGGLMKKKKK